MMLDKISLNKQVSGTLPGANEAAVSQQEFAQFLNRAELDARAAKNAAAGDAAAAKDAAVQAAEDMKLRDACKDFEAMFLNLMLTKMRDTVPDNSLFGTSHGEKIMQSLLDTELTQNMADAGGIGLAAMLYKQVSAYNKARTDAAAVPGNKK